MRPPAGVPALSRRTRILLTIAAIIVVALMAGSRLVNLYVDWLWFGEVSFRSVFSTKLFTNILLFLIGGLLIGGLVALSLWIAYRARPVFVPVSGPEDPVARYRTVIIQRLRLFGIGIPVVVGLIAGLAATGNWQLVQLFLNATPFGTTDPVFNIDIGFYTFQLPFYRWVLDWLFAGVTISFVVALITHYVFGGIRLTGRAGQVSGAARAQLAVLAGVFVLLKAVAYFFDRYELLFSDRADPTFSGATYTDLNAVMPAKLILLFISIICAAAFFAAVFRRNLQLPAIATVLLILSSVLIGAAWPQVLQQFVVAPNAIDKESVPIQRNIDATRTAFGIGPDKVTKLPYDGTSTATPQQVASDKATIPNIRLLDPAKVSATFTQLRQGRAFYGFSQKLDIDRYTENDGTTVQDYIVAARELNASGLTGNQNDWINQHLVYTHGNGLVVAPADKINQPLDENGTNGQGGLPIFTSIDTATVASAPALAAVPKSLQMQQPRIYYGELYSGSDDYSIVGGQSGATPREYDGDNQSYTYTGTGGVPIGNLFNRLVFALKYQERNILFNSSINPDSKIMYVRRPEERVEQVAPWLTTDSDPYPAVVDGKLTWIVDGYTTLPNYPYATPVQFGAATADAQQTTQAAGQNQDISYLRNSVKATVDAYTGAVTLYAFDDTDPVLKTWEKAFPGTVRPSTDISPNLRAHFRYPEDQFKVQRELLTRYHVDSPTQFFGGVSFWDVPSDPTVASGASAGAQPPYYVLAGQPGQVNATTASFQLTSALVFKGRNILSSYVSASSDPATYGKITVLQLPADTQTLGPQQVQSQLVSSPNVASSLGLLNRNTQSSIDYGNLLTLPVAGGLLYVEPVYVERTGQDSSYPQLAKVLVFFGTQIGYAPSLQGALDQIFGKGAGQNAPDAGTTPTPPATGTPPAVGTPNTAALATAAAAIQTAISQVKTAQTSGDLGQLGTALTALDTAVKDYQKLNGQTGG